MASAKQLLAQRDFSSGQINRSAIRRDDVAAVRAGLQQAINMRIDTTGSLHQRPGRRAVSRAAYDRQDYFSVVLQQFMICFSPGQLAVSNFSGTIVFQQGGFAWGSDVGRIVWAQAANDIVITYPGMQPQILRYDPVNNSFSAFTMTILTQFGNQRQPFYNFSHSGIVLTPTDTTGSITIVSSSPYFLPAMVDLPLSILGAQVVITSVISTTAATAAVATRLNESLDVTVQDYRPFSLGQIAELDTGGIKIEIGAITPASPPPVGFPFFGVVSGMMTDTLLPPYGSGVDDGSHDIDTLIGPAGKSGVAHYEVSTAAQYGTEQWSEPFMSNFRGWPASCFYDKQRVGFCDFPQKPSAVLWGAVGGATAGGYDFNIGALASDGILEFMDQSLHVKYVIGLGDEIVFTDLGVYYIPLSTSSPLIPGGVEFRALSNDGCAQVKPVATQDAILFINAGLTRPTAILKTGSLTSQPYVTQDVTDLHSDLFNAPIALATSSGDDVFRERYIYILNAGGSVVVGKLSADKKLVGWTPWASAAPVKWLTVAPQVVAFVSTYSAGIVIELQSNGVYLDGSVPLNNVPANMLTPGVGLLIHLANRRVSVMDGLRDLGTRAVDGTGNIVPIPGEDLASPTLLVGLAYPWTVQPILFQAQPGADQKQRTRRRRVVRSLVTVVQSGGFSVGNRTIAPYRFGDNESVAPPLRAETYSTRVLGRDDDPTVPITGQNGPMTIIEVAHEVTI